MFEQFVNEIISDISQREERQRNRRDDAQHHFEYAVRYLLNDLGKQLRVFLLGKARLIEIGITTHPNQSVIETLI